MSKSNVGTSGIYEAGDQRIPKDPKGESREHYEQGKEKSHKANDAKDERSIANKLSAETGHGKGVDKDRPDDFETKMSKEDSTKPAKMHGNEPSKGAKIDQELEEEEAEMMKKKGEFGHKSGKA